MSKAIARRKQAGSPELQEPALVFTLIQRANSQISVVQRRALAFKAKKSPRVIVDLHPRRI